MNKNNGIEDRSSQNEFPPQGWLDSALEMRGEELGHPEGARSTAAGPSRQKEPVEVVWVSD